MASNSFSIVDISLLVSSKSAEQILLVIASDRLSSNRLFSRISDNAILKVARALSKCFCSRYAIPSVLSTFTFIAVSESEANESEPDELEASDNKSNACLVICATLS